MFRQSACQFDHVFCLTAGVRVTAKFEVMAANQSVDANQGDIETVFRSDDSALPVVDELLIESIFADGGAAPVTDSGSEFSGIA